MADAGAGYNIPISLSNAESWAIPQSSVSPTYFLFGSAGASIGGSNAEANPILPSTAVASAALGGDSTATAAGSGVSPVTDNKTVLIIAGAAVLAAAVIAAAIYLR